MGKQIGELEMDLIEEYYEMAKNFGLSISKHYKINQHDAVDIAIERLMRCAKKGDKSKEKKAKFSTYLYSSIEKDLRKHNANMSDIEFNENVQHKPEGSESGCSINDLMNSFMLCKSFKHRQIYEATKTWQQSDIAKSFNVCNIRVFNIVHKCKDFICNLSNIIKTNM